MTPSDDDHERPDKAETKATPLELCCYFWGPPFRDARDGTYYEWRTKESDLGRCLGEKSQAAIAELQKYHKELCDRYFDPCFIKQLGVASSQEEDHYWMLVDKIAASAKRDFEACGDFEIVGVERPNPDPFRW